MVGLKNKSWQEAKIPAKIFLSYNHLILSLDQQLELLRIYNAQYWNNRITEEQFAAVSTASNQIQSLDNLKVLHVEFGSVARTFKAWYRIITDSASDREGLFRPDEKHLRYSAETSQYKPDIHLVNMNMLSYWNPNISRSVKEVRGWTKDKKRVLAHSEILSFCGMHGDLLEKMDGENLPYINLAGYEFVTDEKSSDWKEFSVSISRLIAGLKPTIHISLATRSMRDCAAPIILAQ